jgi:O-antigen/teichoic acid export membrane protein
MPLSTTVVDEIKGLGRHSSRYLAGIVGGLALGFVSFPIFTRVFSISDYGAIDFVQKIVLLVAAFSKMGQQQSALRFYEVRKDSAFDNSRRYYSTMFFGMCLTSLTIAALCAGAAAVAGGRLIESRFAALLCLASSLIFLRAMESILWSFLRNEERTAAYSIVSVSMKAATIAAVCLLLASGRHSPPIYFAGAIAAELITVALLSFWLFRRRLLSLECFDVPLFRASLAFGAPLVAYEFASLVLDSGDRLLVRQYLGAQALGLYSVAYGLSSYVNELLVVPLGLAIVPIFLRLWTTDGAAKTAKFLSAGLDLYLMAAAAVLAAAIVLSRDALLLLASAKYESAAGLIPVLVAGLLIYTLYVFLSAGLLINKQSLTIAKLLLCSAGINIALNCWLLPRLSLQGAAQATLISYAFCVYLLGRASQRIVALKFEFRALLKYACAAALSVGVASCVAFRSPVLELVVRSTLVLLTYYWAMFALDARVRKGSSRLVRWISYRIDSSRSGIEADRTEVPTF